MPADNGSGCHLDQRFLPSSPALSQYDPEQLVGRSESPARALGVKSEQLLTQGKIFEDDILAGPECTNNPAEDVPEPYDHAQNLTGTLPIELAAKSLILRVYDVLMNDRPVPQRRMRPHRVVLHSPLFDHYLCLLQRVEDLSIQALISQLAVEALTVPVLPGTARFDVQRLGSYCRQPLPQSFRNKLGPIVRSYVFRDTLHQHHIRQRLDQVVTVQPPCHPQGETLAGVLVDQRQQPQRPSILGEGADEVVAPDVVFMLRPKAHARAIVQP